VFISSFARLLKNILDVIMAVFQIFTNFTSKKGITLGENFPSSALSQFS